MATAQQPSSGFSAAPQTRSNRTSCWLRWLAQMSHQLSSRAGIPEAVPSCCCIRQYLFKRLSLMCNQGRAQVPSSVKHVENISRFSSRKQTQVTACKSKYQSGSTATRKILVRLGDYRYCGFFKVNVGAPEKHCCLEHC